MKERPILFSAPMVRAILEGRKTQTRRIVKPMASQREWLRLDDARGPAMAACELGYGVQFQHPLGGPLTWVRCPYGQPGDRLWVRETWARVNVAQFVGEPVFVYPVCDTLADYGGPWKPSIHMPRAASRIHLAITAIRCERLLDISSDDARAEGLSTVTKDGSLWKYGIADRDGLPGNDDDGWHWQEWERDPRNAYRKLWEQINGPGSAVANPWVWVVEFKRATP